MVCKMINLVVGTIFLVNNWLITFGKLDIKCGSIPDYKREVGFVVEFQKVTVIFYNIL